MDAFDGMDSAARLSMEAKEYWVHLDADGSLEKYPAKQHARRVQEKLGVDEGLIYLAGQPAKNNEDSDMPAPFRQRRYFYYLTGCNEPSCHMTYDIQHDTLSLFIPRIDPKRVIWNGRGSTLAEAVERYDIDEVYYVEELGDVIKDWSNYCGGHGSDIYVLHNGQLPRIPGLHAIIDSESLQPAMNAARMIKDDHEISLIRKANDISSEAHKKVLASILKFKNEAQVEGLFIDVCISHQAKQQAYDPIAASGSNAGTLHYDANNENFEDRQLMCLDAGCEYDLYASDITRTFPLAESWPSKEAENIYKLVERMQESCIERLAPGVRYLDLHILAHQIAIDGLLKLGILHNGTREEIYAAGTSRAFFPHGLGHHVGLEVHDVGQTELMSVRRGKAVFEQVPSLFPQNFHTPVFDPALCYAPTDTQSSQLEEGMVVTVEPGIYFSNYALQHFYLPSPIHSRFINRKVLQRYMPVGGVRIEDDILITSKGYENLTTAPKGDAMFDIIRGQSSSFRTAKRPAALPPTDPELPRYRAPGCPLRTTPPGMQPIKRAATIPNQTAWEQLDGTEYYNYSLGFRRSMTTDERVQHWRQSCHRSSASKHPSPHQLESVTVCGSDTNAVKHLYIGQNCTSPFQANDSPQCTNCVILSQTLVRLRQNLDASTQKSAQQPYQPQDPHPLTNSKHSFPTPPAVDAGSYATQCVLATAAERKGIDAGEKPQSHRIGQMPEAKEIPTPPKQQRHVPTASDAPRIQDRTLTTISGKTNLKDAVTVPKEVFDHPLVQSLTNYYQAAARSDAYSSSQEPPSMASTRQQISAYAETARVPDHVLYQALRSEAAMPIRTCRSQPQERRRPSNHTDDRDWMA